MQYIFLNHTQERAFVVDEPTLFVGVNIADDLTLEASRPDTKILAVLLYTESPHFPLTEKTLCHIQQRHLARETQSHVFVRALVPDAQKVTLTGTIHIVREASLSDASFEVRGRLLGSTSTFSAIPALEILPSEVRCHHSATVSQPSPEALWYLQTRGIDTISAHTILNQGFLQEYQSFLENHHIPQELKQQATCDIQSTLV